ncbi:SMI1/KNR4 family protein [Bacteroides ndongoniae]|uniref:SMI1/KNR4 family protein n=1 Tax=Bacteroides ndongoniae TaxID=1903262 RepID=UPI0008D9D8CE|nr:SMI1/KNR4 family protein [Bacteroides ndongoniae]
MDNKTKQKLDKTIAELKQFTSKMLDWRRPVDSALIKRFESAYQVQLPEDYKYLLSITNGFILMGDEVLGINWDGTYDLVDVYRFEHFEVIIPQYKYLIPFSPDGGGNFYCFDTRVKTNGGSSNPIVFWYSSYKYTEADPPEIVCLELAEYIESRIIAPKKQNCTSDEKIGNEKMNNSNGEGIEIDARDKINRALLNLPLKPGCPPTFKTDRTPVEIHYEGVYPHGKFREMNREEHRGKVKFRKH